MLLLSFVKRNFVCESKFSWWLFQLVVLSRFCLKTLPLNTPLFEETVFEKSQVFNLSRFKISICIWWCFCVRVRTFEITEWVFVRFFWNQLWLSFWLVNKEIKVFPGKVTLKESSISYSKMNTLLFFCVFTFRVDRNVFFVDMEIFLMESTFILNEPQLFILQDKHYELSVAFEM